MTIISPQTLPNGCRVWLDPEVADFTDHLKALDPALALVQHEDGRWSIWRVAEDGSEHVIARSQPGARLGPGVIERLRRGDSRNRDVAGDMIRQNNLAEKHRADAEEENLQIALDKVAQKAYRSSAGESGTLEVGS